MDLKVPSVDQVTFNSIKDYLITKAEYTALDQFTFNSIKDYLGELKIMSESPRLSTFNSIKDYPSRGSNNNKLLLNGLSIPSRIIKTSSCVFV